MLDLLENLRGDGYLGPFARTITSGLRRVIPCGAAVYEEVVPAPGRSVAVADPPGAVPSDLEETLTRHYSQHPLITHRLETADPRARRISDLLSQEELRSLSVYRDVLAPMGCEYAASVPLAIGRDVVTRVRLIRGGTDFSESELGLLDLMQPHLVGALQRARAKRGRLQPADEETPREAQADPRVHDLKARGLTDRETHVLALVGEGMSNASIASSLGIKVRTVKKHLERIFSKLGVTNRTTAVAVTLWRAPEVPQPERFEIPPRS